MGAGTWVPAPDEYKSGAHTAQVKIAELLRQRGEYPKEVAIELFNKQNPDRTPVRLSIALYALGVKPLWDANSHITGIETIDLSDLGRPRIDTIVFFEEQDDALLPSLNLLEMAWRKVLSTSYNPLVHTYPELQKALDIALAPLGEYQKGDEPLETNYFASNWAKQTLGFLRQGKTPEEAITLSFKLREINLKEQKPPEGIPVVKDTYQLTTNTLEIIFKGQEGDGEGKGSGGTGATTGSKGVGAAGSTAITNTATGQQKTESTKQQGNAYAISPEPHSLQQLPPPEISLSQNRGVSKGGANKEPVVYEISIEEEPEQESTPGPFLLLLLPLTAGIIYHQKNGYLR
nr:cobaltochelatase subunit CobN [Caldanaerobacter subterraneus]